MVAFVSLFTLETLGTLVAFVSLFTLETLGTLVTFVSLFTLETLFALVALISLFTLETLFALVTLVSLFALETLGTLRAGFTCHFAGGHADGQCQHHGQHNEKAYDPFHCLSSPFEKNKMHIRIGGVSLLYSVNCVQIYYITSNSGCKAFFTKFGIMPTKKPTSICSSAQTVGKLRCVRCGGEKTHKNHFLKKLFKDS